MKKILTISILLFFTLKISAQNIAENKSTFYVNVFINENKDIRIESELIAFNEISKEDRNRIYEHPFKIDEGVTYRVFADKNLALGYIMDVEEKLYAGYSQNARRERYLLETVELEIDGPNWFKKLEGAKFEKM